jgi:hypothetical protein
MILDLYALNFDSDPYPRTVPLSFRLWIRLQQLNKPFGITP